MYNEELVEEGIVKESNNGIATVIISNSDYCEECTAKLYCKPGNSKERSLIVKDPIGVNPGDKVRVAIKGSEILKISFLIYGIPLILLMIGLIIGMQIFESNKELFSTIISIGLVLCYIFIIFFVDKKRKNGTRSYPKIVFVSTRQAIN